MATLETQYKNYLLNNPDSNFTFEEWKEWWGENIRKAFEDLKEYERNKENDQQHRPDKTST